MAVPTNVLLEKANMTGPFKYRAFLSYSHADTPVAKRVHGLLEAFRFDKDLIGRETPRGPIPETLRPIFRDRLEFETGRSLMDATIEALDQSAALIVLGSPDAARSKYVNEELRQFKARHPDRPVIPLIVRGGSGDPMKECFPPALSLATGDDATIAAAGDVLASDLREEGDGIDLALAKVIARLIGLAPDEVYRRAERERRIQRRRVRQVQAVIYALLLAVIGGLIGWINQDYLKERINWFLTMRPYMLAQVRPYVLSAAAEYELRPSDSFKECAKDCPDMIVIPVGTFAMGSLATEKGRFDNEGPVHEVRIAKPFAVSKFDVTFDQWDACVAVGGCVAAPDGGYGRGTRPVINVTWRGALQYVEWFAKMTGKPYRMLTEAEWEYAARAGTASAYFWGGDVGVGNANCDGCGSQWDRKGSAPVGSFKPNAFGLYDMAGNVWEWLADCYHDNYQGAPTDDTIWSSEDCERHVVRAGSWLFAPQFARSASRYRYATDVRVGHLGLRLARTLTP